MLSCVCFSEWFYLLFFARDVLIDDAFKDQIEVIAVDTLDEVMESALVSNENKSSLVERLGAVIDRLTPNPSGNPSA